MGRSIGRLALAIPLALALVTTMSSVSLSTATAATPTARGAATAVAPLTSVARAAAAARAVASIELATATSGKHVYKRLPTGLKVGTAAQVITVQPFSVNRAVVKVWRRVPGGWVLIWTFSGHVGAKGVVVGRNRKQGDDKTPTGAYTLTQAFGIAGNPGTKLSYFRVHSNDWWVEDNNSKYYNQHRTSQQGGFNMKLSENSVNGSERLITHTTAYQQAIVINYNMPPSAARYLGAGIFLHVDTGHGTAGCVSIPKADLLKLMRWLSPTAHPVIAIS
jgi:L,D-peptidoglycan transpeptidase YkuD (ErfK/YbiS/YcfS/YnhG family)